MFESLYDDAHLNRVLSNEIISLEMKSESELNFFFFDKVVLQVLESQLISIKAKKKEDRNSLRTLIRRGNNLNTQYTNSKEQDALNKVLSSKIILEKII